MKTTPPLNVAIDDAEKYFETRLYADKWNDATDGDKRKALATAAFLIGGAFEFRKDAFSVGSDDDTSVVWSPRVVAGVCEEALWLLKQDPTTIPNALFLGISNAKAGSVESTFDKSFVAPLICDAAKTIIGELGTFLEAGGGVYSTPIAL